MVHKILLYTCVFDLPFFSSKVLPTCLTGKTEAKAIAKDSASTKQKVRVVEFSKVAKAEDGDESTDESADEDDSMMGEVCLSSNLWSMLYSIVITYVYN